LHAINPDRDRNEKKSNPIAIAIIFFQTRSDDRYRLAFYAGEQYRFHWTFFRINRDRDRD